MSLKIGRYGATLDIVDRKPVVCGGGDGDSAFSISCLVFDGGKWSDYANPLKLRRAYHSSWVSTAGLVLMGGWGGQSTTTEIVPSGGGQSVQGFSLIHDSR